MIVTSLRMGPYNLEVVWGNTQNAIIKFPALYSKMADKLELMAAILKQHNLGNLVEVFQKEKITPDIVSLLSVREMNQLGINNRGDMMKLRMVCAIHGKRKPPKERLRSGPPTFHIPKAVLENHI